MPFDKFGIPYFYPTKSTAGVSGEGTGFFWQQNNNIREDQDDGMVRLGKESDDVEVINTTTGEWEFPFDSGADYFCLEVRQGHKSGGESHGCEGACYIYNVAINETPAKFYFQKQMYHGGSKHIHPETGTFGSSFVTEKVVGNGWKGFAAVVYDKKDGRSPGHDSAILEIWWNEDPVADIKDWKMIKRIEDKGGWGTGGDTCDGVSDQVITWSNIQFRYKSGTPDFSLHPIIPEFEDGPVIHSIGGANMSFEDSENRDYGKDPRMPGDVEMKCLFKFDSNNGICRLKNLSLREIDPTKSFDDDPDTPPGGGPPNTQTIQGNFTLKWDLNTSRVSACAGSGGGGGGGSTIFYSVGTSVDKELSNTSGDPWDNRTRVAQKVDNSSSAIHGKVIKQADVWLKKVGTPGASPVINFKIWDSSNVVKYTSATTIDPTTLTTSFVKTTFDCSANTYACVTGDRIGVEYTGTSSSNYIVTSYNSSEGTGSTNSFLHQYEAGVWDTSHTNRNLAMDLWQ